MWDLNKNTSVTITTLEDSKIFIIDNVFAEPKKLETTLNNIPGVVDNGIFAFNKPEIVLISK